MIKKVNLIVVLFLVFFSSCSNQVDLEGFKIRKFYLANEKFDYMDNQVLYYEKRDLTEKEVECLIEVLKDRDIDYYISSNGQIYVESSIDDETRIGVDFDITGVMYLCSGTRPNVEDL